MFGKVALNLIFFILNVSNTFKRRFKKNCREVLRISLGSFVIFF